MRTSSVVLALFACAPLAHAGAPTRVKIPAGVPAVERAALRGARAIATEQTLRLKVARLPPSVVAVPHRLVDRLIEDVATSPRMVVESTGGKITMVRGAQTKWELVEAMRLEHTKWDAEGRHRQESHRVGAANGNRFDFQVNRSNGHGDLKTRQMVRTVEDKTLANGTHVPAGSLVIQTSARKLDADRGGRDRERTTTYILPPQAGARPIRASEADDEVVAPVRNTGVRY